MYQKSLPEGNVAVKSRHTFDSQLTAHQKLCTSKNHNNNLRERGRTDYNTPFFTLIHALISMKLLPPVFWALSWQSGAEVCWLAAPSSPLDCFLLCPLQLSTRCIPSSVDCHAALFSWRRQKWSKTAQCAPPFVQKSQMTPETSQDVATIGLVFLFNADSC